MKILNLYAGIGGNRALWGDEHEIVAVECDIDLRHYKIKNKTQVIRNQVNPNIGKHILDCALKRPDVAHRVSEVFI